MPVISPNKPTAPTRPVKAEQRDYPTIALTAWLDFQLAKCDIDVIVERLEVYWKRFCAAEIWFCKHDKTHPQHAAACVLYNQLDHEQSTDQVLLQMRARGALYHLWNCVLAVDHCIFNDALYASVSALDDLSSVLCHCKAERGPGDRVTRARAIVAVCWQQLLPKCPIPAYMPDDHRANWVEYRLGAVPTWQMDELQEALDEKRKR